MALPFVLTSSALHQAHAARMRRGDKVGGRMGAGRVLESLGKLVIRSWSIACMVGSVTFMVPGDPK